MELARKLYSSKSSAQSAVQKLELLGYIKNTAPGAFKVEKITPDVRERYQEKRGDQGSSESSFVKEPASP